MNVNGDDMYLHVYEVACVADGMMGEGQAKVG